MWLSLKDMRPVQVMRYGRRTTPTSNEILRSISQNESISNKNRRQSLFTQMETESDRLSTCLIDEDLNFCLPTR